MKQISISFFFSLAVFLNLGCKQNHSSDSSISQIPNTTSMQPTENAEDIIQAVATYRKTYLNTSFPKSASIQKDAKDYTRTEKNPSVWLSLSTIKNFTDYIKQCSDSLKKDENDLGIRFYFGLNKNGTEVICMVPTINVNSEPVDFDPYITLSETKKGSDSVAYMSYVLNNKGPHIDITSLILDSTRPCPPTCPLYRLGLLNVTDTR